MKSINLFYIIISLLLISCNTLKPTIGNIPEVDKVVPIYYCNNKSSFSLNGQLLYESNSFGSTSASKTHGDTIQNTDANSDYIFNYPLGKMDYSYKLTPSLSISGRYMAKADDDFQLLQIRLTRNVDVKIVDLQQSAKVENYTLTLPKYEYKDEQYQIQWSKNEDSFWGLKGDSLFKFYPSKGSQCILVKEKIYDFSVSPSGRNVLVFANDSLFLFDLYSKTFESIYIVGRTLGINRKYIRAINWYENEAKITFAIGWKIYVYEINTKSLNDYDLGQKIFSSEWINNNQILCVTGEYPSDMSQMHTEQSYKIRLLSTVDKKNQIIHERYNHEPFSIKPKLSPSKQLILYSERKLHDQYEVKLMSLDGKNEIIVAEGYLPFWGSQQVNNK
jgi:hypothetical protein